MTVRDLGAAVLRRWYVVVLMLLVAVVGAYLLRRGEGVYTTETVVSFTLPDKTTLSPNSGLDDASVIAFAGVVATAVNHGTTPAIYSSYDAPLYGAGVRQGVVVSLPDAGNQFVSGFQRAEVVLQIVGPTERWVADTQRELLKQVAEISKQQQASVTVPASRIRMVPVVPTQAIFRVSPSNSSSLAAFAALLVAASLVGVSAAVGLDGVLRRRRITANEGPER